MFVQSLILLPDNPMSMYQQLDLMKTSLKLQVDTCVSLFFLMCQKLMMGLYSQLVQIKYDNSNFKHQISSCIETTHCIQLIICCSQASHSTVRTTATSTLDCCIWVINFKVHLCLGLPHRFQIWLKCAFLQFYYCLL